MPITIRKQDGDIKFYGSQPEPIVVIYSGREAALLNYVYVGDAKTASEVAEAAMIAGLFVNAMLNKDDPHFKTNNIEVEYINEGNLSSETAHYSSRKILHWVESDKIVTINTRKKIRYKFTKFSYQDGKLVILYKPVVW